MFIVSHIALGVNGEESYMEDFYSTQSRPFLEGVGPIKKQNRDWLVGCVCATATLNLTISGGEWSHDRMVSEPDLQP